MAILALHALTSGDLSALDYVPEHVEAQDLWLAQDRGAVLFWLGAEVEVWGFRRPVLSLMLGERERGGAWRLTGADTQAAPTDNAVANLREGVYSVGSFAQRGFELTIAIASPSITSIALTAADRTEQRWPGSRGFFVLEPSPTADRSITAHAREGSKLTVELLPL